MAPRKETNAVQRSKVILLHERGESERKISEELKIAKSTVHDIISKYKKTKSIENQAGRGRKKLLSPRNISYLKQKVKEDPFQSMQNLANTMEEVVGCPISRMTITRELKKCGIKAYEPRRKPFISNINKQKRLDYAKKYVKMPISFWKKIIWTDESKFNIKGSDGRQKVKRPAGQALNPMYMRATVKHGGGSVMVWGAMCYAGVGNLHFIRGIMDSNGYRVILENNLSPTTKKYRMGRNFILLHDNDPKHKSKLVTEYLRNRDINVMDHPPQSPDLNVIEHLWDEIGRRLLKKNIRNKNECEEEIKKIWSEISPDITKKLVESMPRRLEEVIKNKGGNTSY